MPVKLSEAQSQTCATNTRDVTTLSFQSVPVALRESSKNKMKKTIKNVKSTQTTESTFRKSDVKRWRSSQHNKRRVPPIATFFPSQVKVWLSAGPRPLAALRVKGRQAEHVVPIFEPARVRADTCLQKKQSIRSLEFENLTMTRVLSARKLLSPTRYNRRRQAGPQTPTNPKPPLT